MTTHFLCQITDLLDLSRSTPTLIACSNPLAISSQQFGCSQRRLHSVISACCGTLSVSCAPFIKPFFKRERPTVKGDSRFKIRKPRTSSFPSGHASSAFFAAVVLTRWSSWPAIATWFAFAVIVATSRVAVRIHHATDIVAGALIGTTMGLLANSAISLL
ncbi:MAG: phosphatase PAP2 family protein [Actinobacteria bacterium]|nr:phosphatase PAP2 family protein [Actinomycetota bacterium]